MYVQTASEIDELMEQLEISRLSNFEKMALDKEREFQLSEKNMEMLNVRFKKRNPFFITSITNSSLNGLGMEKSFS